MKSDKESCNASSRWRIFLYGSAMLTDFQRVNNLARSEWN